MAALLSLAAWIFDLLLGFLSAALAGWFFLFSPTFRHQAYARWARRSAAAKDFSSPSPGTPESSAAAP